jgi:predicted phosphodiesterase
MKIAILGDIHGNLEALEAVLIAAEKERVEHLYCLGDIVGYGPDPRGCIYRLREAGAVPVLGNHDQAVVLPQHIKAFNALARETLWQSREMLGESELDYVSAAAFRRIAHGAVFAHANPLRPEEWDYLFMYDRIGWCMERMDWQIAFVGHTHYAGIYCRLRSQIVPLTSSAVAIGQHQYLINPGSVGQPRDGNWRASFALWDVEGGYVEVRRVEYPLALTQKKLARAGWPAYLAERLARGE